jgi:hypothetical protein
VRVVDFLLRNQTGPLPRNVRQPGKPEMRDLVGGFGARDIVPGARLLGAAPVQGGFGAGPVVCHLGDLEQSQQLPLAHPVTRIYVDLL